MVGRRRAWGATRRLRSGGWRARWLDPEMVGSLRVCGRHYQDRCRALARRQSDGPGSRCVHLDEQGAERRCGHGGRALSALWQSSSRGSRGGAVPAVSGPRCGCCHIGLSVSIRCSVSPSKARPRRWPGHFTLLRLGIHSGSLTGLSPSTRRTPKQLACDTSGSAWCRGRCRASRSAVGLSSPVTEVGAIPRQLSS